MLGLGVAGGERLVCCRVAVRRSWREFPHPDEEDVEGAESREHRRWIERQNAKLREKGARLLPPPPPRLATACSKQRLRSGAAHRAEP